MSLRWKSDLLTATSNKAFRAKFEAMHLIGVTDVDRSTRNPQACNTKNLSSSSVLMTQKKLSLWSSLTFQWVTPMLQKAYKESIELQVFLSHQ
jgi:hypothetical protein